MRLLLLLLLPAHSFLSMQYRFHRFSLLLASSSSSSDEDEDSAGAELAKELFQMANSKGIKIEPSELSDEEDDEEDEDDDETEPNIPQGAINAFLGYDTGSGVGEKLAGNVSLTDSQLYSEVKERVLDTAGGFLDYISNAEDEEEDDDASNDETTPSYVPHDPIPDADLTAGEVIMIVLEALRNNDTPREHTGVDILFGFSSENNYIRDLAPAEYAQFLKDTEEYKILLDHDIASIDKGDYSFDGKKAFFTARLKNGLTNVSVNFILSTKGKDACWLIDSMLIRPQSMQRRRRR